MSSWFYIQNSQQTGPIEIQVLQQMAASRQLQPGDMVWSQGMAQWQPAAQTAGIFPAGTIPPPLAAMPIGYATPGPYPGGPPPLGSDPGVRWLLPVGRSGWAIAAGYLGLLSVLMIPAPLALIFGIIAIRDIRKHPHRHGMGRAIFGIAMGAIFSVGFVILILAKFKRF